ncbi:unnamed protein product, partial [Symbiodinium pilosum]
VDAELSSTEQNECEALRRLIQPIRAGDLVAVLSDSWLQTLAAVLTRKSVDSALAAGGLPHLVADLVAAGSSFLNNPEGCKQVRERGLYMLLGCC